MRTALEDILIEETYVPLIFGSESNSLVPLINLSHAM